MKNGIYDVELAEAEIEVKEPVNVGFSILLYAKLRMFDLYYYSLVKFCDMNKFEELEMDTDSQYLLLTVKELEDCIRPEMKAEWECLRSKDCSGSFTAGAVATFSPRRAVRGTKNMSRESLDKRISDARRCCA